MISLELLHLNRAEAMRYMGYKNKKPDENVLSIIDECESALLKVCKPRYIYKVFDIQNLENGISVIGTSLLFKGNDIRSHLSECNKCILLCATVSIEADKIIRSYETIDMTKAVIADCLASAAVEQVCNQAEIEIKNNLPDYNFTWRFSPGYGDFPLNIQPEFLNVLDAQKRIGVNCTESLILIPRKSVTAVMGISKNKISKGKRGCVSCNMRDRCEYRKRGDHCGF
ncbi:MAG: methionine synthase [Ruminococcus sp.]|nr:methionine synthase [Ruminococcus sp.]